MPRLGTLALLLATAASAQSPDRLGVPEAALRPEAALAVASVVAAPETIAFQGVLEDGGAPVPDGTYAVRIRLYALPNSLLILFAEDHSVQTEDGVFTLSIGGGTGVSGNEFDFIDEVNFAETVWVEVEVDGTTLSPRTPIESVPLARTLVAGATVESDKLWAIRGTNTKMSELVYGGFFETFSESGVGVEGRNFGTNGTTYGVVGRSFSTSGRGVYGSAASSTGSTIGGHFESSSTSGRGVYGTATASSGLTRGVDGRSASTGGRGVYGEASATTGATIGVAGASVSTSGFGVQGIATATTGITYGVYGRVNSASGYAGFFEGGQGVYTDGAYLGGGADLAEWFPVAASVSPEAVRPGDLVGLRGGAVSLDTEAAEQVMIASTDPAFVGNPDASAGGALVALVGQAEVRLSGTASVGDLLVASGRDDGTARAVAPEAYRPEADGPVAGRVLSLPEAGRAVALVGVDEAAALRAVVERQAAEIEALRADRDRQQAQIDAVLARLARLESSSAPAPLPPAR